MDYKHIEELLEKYWNGETSLDEEQQLKAFFRSDDVPASMKTTADLFRFFEAERSNAVEENFDRSVAKQLRQRRGGKVVAMMSFARVARIAAGIAVVVASVYFVREEVRKAYPEEMMLEDTYDDPRVAFEETKKALMMISKSFGKAKSEAEKIKMFNEAEKKIQNKEDEKKSEALI
jgi:hypothetical protein